MTDTEKKTQLEGGDEEENDLEGELEDVDEAVEEEQQEEEEEEEEVKPVKVRRCLRRRKIKQICFDDEGEDEDEDEEEGGDELFYEDEEEDEEEEEDEDIVSQISSVLSAISFVWEDEIYEFEELCDVDTIESIQRRIETKQPTSDYSGVSRYLEVCKGLCISPMMRIIHYLNCEEMDLSHCNISSKTIRALCAALENNAFVKRLLMKLNKLNVDDCHYLGHILGTNEKLAYLDFSGCRFGPECLEMLVVNMGDNEILEHLNLSKCKIGDTGMDMLAGVLKRNNSIEFLDLSHNELDEESVEYLAVALRINTCIKTLILRYNNLFYPAGMKKFFRALTFNTSITHLDLSWNGLSGEDIGNSIGNYLRRGRSLEHFDLSDNRFQGAAVGQIKKGLAKSKSLSTFRIGKNPLLPEDLEALLGGVKANSNIKVFDLEDLWVKKPFIKTLGRILQDRELEVNFAGVLGNYEVFGPDYPKVILQRAQFEALKPKKASKRKDFGHLLWTLGNEPMTTEEFMKRVKKFKAKISKELFPELIKQFTIPKIQLIDVQAMREKYLTIFPDSKPPPSKSKKGVEEILIKEAEAEEEEEEEEELYLDEYWDEEEDEEEMIDEGELDEGELFIEGVENAEVNLDYSEEVQEPEEEIAEETVAEEANAPEE